MLLPIKPNKTLMQTAVTKTLHTDIKSRKTLQICTMIEATMIRSWKCDDKVARFLMSHIPKQVPIGKHWKVFDAS